MILTGADRARIESAVRAAETRTQGEIYCVVANESSDYREVTVAWAAIFALAAPAILLAAGIQITAPALLNDSWTAAQMTSAAESAARMALMGAILLQGALFIGVAILINALAPLRRFMTPKSLKAERVGKRAREQFLARNLAATRARTGVLIYVSVREKMAELIPDDGVSSKVDQHAWDAAMAALVLGLKHKRPAEGFENAIARIADILAAHVPAGTGDNPNELSDSVLVLP